MKLLALLFIFSNMTQSARENIEKHIEKTTHNRKYAHTLAIQIEKCAKEEKLSPYLVAAVASVESDYQMESKPCCGIMQISLPAYRNYYIRTGLNPHKFNDNIKLGSMELHSYFYHKKVLSKGINYKLRFTLGRYNGCGSKGRYVDKVLKRYKEIKYGKQK